MTFLKAYSGNVVPRDQLHLEDGATIAVSPTGDGILRYNDTTKTFQVSIDGAPYVDIGGGGGGGVGMGGVFANANSAVFSGQQDYLIGGSKATTEGEGRAPVPAAGNFSKLYVLPDSVNTLDGDTIVTVRVNGAPTALTATVPALSSAQVSDLVNVAAVAAGDNFSIEVDTLASTVGSMRSIAVGFQYSV